MASPTCASMSMLTRMMGAVAVMGHSWVHVMTVINLGIKLPSPRRALPTMRDDCPVSRVRSSFPCPSLQHHQASIHLPLVMYIDKPRTVLASKDGRWW